MLYENISAADMILCLVLHGDHWCLVAIDLKERRMVYLDSLFNGVGAQTAFTRFAYFLECAFVSQSKVLDWKEWQYYIIPSTEIEQQTNSVDCGVFVVKWAQHIAEGRPLDFSQTQIDDFRYSLILDIANGDGSPSNLATEPGQVSDDQARPFLASSGLANDCGKANNSSCTNLKGKVQKQPYQADSDSDFESPKKRQKTDPCRESPLVSGNDHTYAKDAKQPDIHTRGEQIPECAQKIFPSGYQYKCHEFREMPMDNFTGAPKDNFYVKLSVSHITTKEDVDHWLQQFTASSNIKYNTQGGYKQKGVKVIYAQWYICQCKRKKLTKKQVTEKEAALKRKQKRHGTHKDNSGMEGCDLHLLSKAREKKTDCNSKMSIRINRNKKMPYQCEIDLWWNHNHSVHCFYLTSFCPILPATRDKFCTYFEEGMSASEAFHYHETQLMKDPVTLMLLADRKMSPSLPDVNNLYGKWLIEKKGPSNGSAIFDQLEKIVEDYNRKNANIGGKCFLQRVQGNDADQKHLILSICDPLMSRVHTTKQAGEMAFMDSSGSLDRYNNPVYFMYTHHPCGALPLAVWVTSSQSQSCLESCLEQLKDLVFAKTPQEFEEIKDLFVSDTILQKYSLYQGYLNKAIDRRKEWALCYRTDLRTRDNNTDNYTESMIFVFKCVVLRRMRAYNLIELFRFITEDLEMYFQQKLLSLAFGKPQNLHLAARCFGRTASSVSQSTITINEKNPCKFHMPSRDDNSTITYIVDCTSGTCTCQQGVSGNACPHQAAVALKLRINNINFIPQTAKERFNLAILAIGDKKNFSVGQFVSLHQKEIESKPPFYGDQEKDEEQQTLLPMPDSPETETMETNDGIIDAGTDATLPNDEVSLDQIIKLHQQVSQDIEYKLRTSDTNFCLCYYKYLTLYRKIISKCRGQAPVASLASVYAQFGKERGGNYLPVLHNSSRIKVQPTAISRRKSGIKSASAQPSGRRPKLSGSQREANMKVRKKFNNQKRRRNLSNNVRKNLPNAGPKR